MRKILLPVLLSFVWLNAIWAQQQPMITGKVLDTLENKPLSHAVISLIYKKDSTLSSFTRSTAGGEFVLPKVYPGKYVVLITYPKFADYADELEVGNQPVIDLGTIALTQKAVLLKEVIVRSGQAIRIKGDTTEFVADSFFVREGATVEDLLKKLPGFQVNSKGEITAQGQRVQKVLVDGEEFFGDDPTMATQNISAKAVDKVQVFDTKTEQQQLKGIAAGNEGKTVNIKLKEESKKGSFGKMYAGSDFRDYVDAKGLYNKFVGKKKMSVYGTKSNINTGSLNWEDRQKLGIEQDVEYDEINGYFYSFGGSDEFNDWSLRGLPNSYTAGGLFANKWNSDRQSINTSYRYNRLGTENVNSTLIQNILNTEITYTNKQVRSNGLNQQHAFNGKYEWRLDSLTSFKITTAGTYKTTEYFGVTSSDYSDSTRQYINQSNIVNNNEAIRINSDNIFQYKQLFKKKNRILLATLRYGRIENDQSGILNTGIKYYDKGVYQRTDTLDQQKLVDERSATAGSKITFSEPLSLTWSLVMEYSYNQNQSSSHRNTYEKSFNGKYEMLNRDYSNNFDLNAFSHSSSALMKYIGKKLKMAFGSGVSSTELRMVNLDSNKRNTYNFFNLTPEVQFNYSIKQQTNVSFNYRGSTRQPGISQLQPIRDNNDPLNEYIGNPDLKVGFNHNLNLYYNDYKVLAGRSLYVNARLNVLQNAITNYNIVDSVGKRIYQPVNVDGNYNWSFYGYWGKRPGGKQLNRGLNMNANGGKNINFVNGVQSVNRYTTSRLSGNLGRNSEKFNFSISLFIGYNASTSTLRSSINNNYFIYGGNADAFVLLPGKLEVASNVNADLRQRITAFDQNTNLVVWNASLAKKVFKDKSGKIIFSANDILDQNKGYNRIINSNFVQDERFLRISRYFLLKFEWTFNKMPGSK